MWLMRIAQTRQWRIMDNYPYTSRSSAPSNLQSANIIIELYVTKYLS